MNLEDKDPRIVVNCTPNLFHQSCFCLKSRLLLCPGQGNLLVPFGLGHCEVWKVKLQMVWNGFIHVTCVQ